MKWQVRVLHYNGSSSTETVVSDTEELFINNLSNGVSIERRGDHKIAFFGSVFSAIKEQVDE